MSFHPVIDLGVTSAQRCTEALFSGKPSALVALSEPELRDLFRAAPTTEIYLEPGTTLLDTVMATKCFSRIG